MALGCSYARKVYVFAIDGDGKSHKVFNKHSGKRDLRKVVFERLYDDVLCSVDEAGRIRIWIQVMESFKFV